MGLRDVAGVLTDAPGWRIRWKADSAEPLLEKCLIRVPGMGLIGVPCGSCSRSCRREVHLHRLQLRGEASIGRLSSLLGEDKEHPPLIRTLATAANLITRPEFPRAGNVELPSALCIDGFPRRKDRVLIHVFSIPILASRIPHPDKRKLQLNRFISDICQ